MRLRRHPPYDLRVALIMVVELIAAMDRSYGCSRKL